MENTLEKESSGEILEKYSSYEGTLSNFFNENNITKHQLYYYKKKFKKSSKPLFHAIALKPSKNLKDVEKGRKDIHSHTER